MSVPHFVMVGTARMWRCYCPRACLGLAIDVCVRCNARRPRTVEERRVVDRDRVRERLGSQKEYVCGTCGETGHNARTCARIPRVVP
jgi:hypothetical protein